MKTREIRWFFEQPHLPLASFYEGLPPQAQTLERRTDRYLASLLTDELGVKLREGRLEIKSRIGAPEQGKIAPGMEGFIETWVKHGFQLRSAESPGLPGGSDAKWLDVTKERWVTLVDATEATLRFYPAGQYSSRTVQMEYTRVTVFKDQWYTFGLEWLASGLSDIPESFFVGVFQGASLGFQQSMGYPAFLGRYVQKPS